MADSLCCVNGHPLTDEDQSCPICGTARMPTSIIAPLRPILPSIPGYEVIEELGQGGMGIVYKAKHLQLDRWVALKMIRNWSFASAEERSRFQAEAHAIAQLQHSGIVQIFDIGEWQGMPFLSLEFIEGGTLEKKLGGQPMAPTEAARLLLRIVEPIAFAHSRGILHRDLKPANILLTREGSPKIGDFGLAKKMDSSVGLTHPDALVGTPCYMAPEQAERRNRTIGPTADIYALGVILYEMLTGRPPFLGENALETMKQVVEQEPVSPRRLHPSVPRDLETICLKCLHKDPLRRYESAALLGRDLESFLTGKPIQARPVSRWEITWRWCARNPLPASLFGLLVVVVLAGFSLVTWKWLEAENEKNQKENALEQIEKANYLITIRTAHRVWEEGNSPLAERLLAGLKPSLRQWEWDFLRNLHRSSAMVVHRLEERPNPQAIFGGDGRSLVSLSGPTTVDMRNARTGAFARRLADHRHRLNCLAMSSDSLLLAGGDEGNGITLWDLEKLSLRERLEPLPGKITSVAISPDRALLAFGWRGGYAVRSLKEPTKQLEKWQWKVRRSDSANLTFSRDSKFLATGNADGAIEIVRLDGDSAPQRIESAHIGEVTALAYSGDGAYLVSGGSDGLLKIWDAEKKTWQRTHEGSLGVVTALAISSDSELLASASQDSVVRLWNLQAGTANAVLRGHESAVMSLSFSADGLRLASCGDDRTLRIWDLNAGDGTAAVHFGRGWVFSAIARDQQQLFLGDTLGSRMVTLDLSQDDPPTHKTVLPIDMNVLAEIGNRHLTASADGDWIALADARPTDAKEGTTAIHVWNTRTGKLKAMLKVAPDMVRQLAFHPQDARLLASAEKNGRVMLWHLDEPEKYRSLAGFKGTVLALAFSDDGRWLAAGGADKEIRVWQVASTSTEPVAIIRTAGTVQCLTFNPKGDRLAYWAGAKEQAPHPIEIVDWHSGAVEVELRGPRQKIFSLAFHPRDARLLSLGADDVLRLWDVSSGSEIVRWPNRDPHGSDARVFFNPDGRFAVSASRNKVTLWDGRPSLK